MQKKRIYFSFDLKKLLLLMAIITFIMVEQISDSVAKFSTQLSSASQSARVARWSVSIAIDNSPVSVKNECWSSPIKLDIINNSEVLACYGRTGENGETALQSVLTISDLSDRITQVRVFDPESGAIACYGTEFNHSSIAIRFFGTLSPGETKTYYIQLFAHEDSSFTGLYSKTVSIDTNFHFEQAFNTVSTSLSMS